MMDDHNNTDATPMEGAAEETTQEATPETEGGEEEAAM